MWTISYVWFVYSVTLPTDFSHWRPTVLKQAVTLPENLNQQERFLSLILVLFTNARERQRYIPLLLRMDYIHISISWKHCRGCLLISCKIKQQNKLQIPVSLKRLITLQNLWARLILVHKQVFVTCCLFLRKPINKEEEAKRRQRL
jgi:hypothetical protein